MKMTMKYVDEFREPAKILQLAERIKTVAQQSWTIMEICGGQTHTIVKYGLEQLLPDHIRIIHGPGCPVCVTSIALIDKAIAIAQQENVTFCSFGDMLRVPGSRSDLLSAKASGADIQVVYSPLDALSLAKKYPKKDIVFFAIGFETTAPANAMAIFQAKKQGLKNFSVLVSHVLVPPALSYILNGPDNVVQGLLAAGHVCTVMGIQEYEPLCERYNIPIIVTGFEPLDIMQGVLACITQLEKQQANVENQYARCVKPHGNVHAQQIIQTVFHKSAYTWRGLGEMQDSGLQLNDAYRDFDANRRFQMDLQHPTCSPSSCHSGQILQGKMRPFECPEFAKTCTPDHPLGAPMVSQEGSCAAYYYHQRRKVYES